MDALLRHPRRLGFFAFNIIALACLVAWVVTTQNDAETLGVFGLPFYALGYLGIGFLVLAWVIAWIAWFRLIGSGLSPIARRSELLSAHTSSSAPGGSS